MVENKDKKVLNVPNLRFPEFQGEWKKCKLGDVCNTSTGNKNTQDKTDDGIYPFYVRSQTVERINSWTFDGEAILTAGDGVGVGKVFHHTYGKIGVHQRVYILSDFKCDANYLFHFFSSKFYNRVKRMSAKNSVDSVRKEMITDMPLSLPCCQEQIKIGYMLSILDERIATQNKIIEDLKKLKSAISERLFKDAKGDVITLAEICDIVKGKQINGELLSEHGKYYVMNGGTEPSGYYDNYNVEADTISISEGGNSCGYVQFNKYPFWSGGHCYSIQNIADNIDNLYLYHYLKSKEDAIMKLRIGSGLPNIQKKDLAMFKIEIPTIKQQKTISTFLSSLERKAEIEERIQNAMLKEKQFLLRQMFI
jgi:type I restriction endonuclease S subunit